MRTREDPLSLADGTLNTLFTTQATTIWIFQNYVHHRNQLKDLFSQIIILQEHIKAVL